MSEINTVMEPYTWNHTQVKGTSFSRSLVFDADLTSAEYEIAIIGDKGTFIPVLKVISIINNTTIINISLTAKQMTLIGSTNKWFMKITFRSETFICWKGQFTVRPFI